ncbi:MAG: NADH-quinone oxidoreductase subunit C [Deltaproteobacteria bacterium]|nr:NADH-quinone oxidoreductase subunit C [Deltaproteobacteria bacterium]
MAQRILDRLKETFGAKILETSSPSGDEVAVVARDDWPAVARFLRDDPVCAMDMFIDLTCADYPDRRERLEVWLRLYSIGHRHRVCLKTRVSAEDPKVPSLYDLWRGIDWFEREAFDLFGVVFAGHPDLRRILLYEGFEGHPLRKDYAAEKTQPLVGYREVPPTKVPPFGTAEGMPWSRR